LQYYSYPAKICLEHNNDSQRIHHTVEDAYSKLDVSFSNSVILVLTMFIEIQRRVLASTEILFVDSKGKV